MVESYLHWIDAHTSGDRCDVTPLFAHPRAFNALIDDLVARIGDTSVDLVACIDALGFVLGTALAQRLGVGILTVRKGGKLPVQASRIGFRDYTGREKELEIRRDVLIAGQRVLVVDEWIETGAQVTAAIRLVEEQGATVVGVAAINIDHNEHTEPLISDYRVWTV